MEEALQSIPENSDQITVECNNGVVEVEEDDESVDEEVNTWIRKEMDQRKRDLCFFKNFIISSAVDVFSSDEDLELFEEGQLSSMMKVDGPIPGIKHSC